MKKRALLLSFLAVPVLISLFVILDHGPMSEIVNNEGLPFSGARAYDHVDNLVQMGPRSIGSVSIEEARRYIIEVLQSLNIEIIRDPFNATFMGTDYQMENIIAIIPGSGEGLIAVGGHYDTKEIPGANDGGSSTGLLLEMARVLVKENRTSTIWIIFFDGEDTGDDPSTMFHGSRHMARDLESRGQAPHWLIIADMIGDRNLMIRRDRNSDEDLTDYIWEKAEELGYGRHFGDSTLMVLDDHVPFMDIGVPSCVLIDFEYGPLNSYWHTHRDDMDKISESSLKVAGDVIYRAVLGIDGGELEN